MAFAIRDNVQTQPGSSLWAEGFRFGEVLAVNAKRSEVLVHFDSGARLWVACAAVLEV